MAITFPLHAYQYKLNLILCEGTKLPVSKYHIEAFFQVFYEWWNWKQYIKGS